MQDPPLVTDGELERVFDRLVVGITARNTASALAIRLPGIHTPTSPTDSPAMLPIAHSRRSRRTAENPIPSLLVMLDGQNISGTQHPDEGTVNREAGRFHISEVAADRSEGDPAPELPRSGRVLLDVNECFAPSRHVRVWGVESAHTATRWRSSENPSGIVSVYLPRELGFDDQRNTPRSVAR